LADVEKHSEKCCLRQGYQNYKSWTEKLIAEMHR